MYVYIYFSLFCLEIDLGFYILVSLDIAHFHICHKFLHFHASVTCKVSIFNTGAQNDQFEINFCQTSHRNDIFSKI